jgi:hypothetical protein
MRGGAGTGPGRACATLMSDLRAGDSFDMAGELPELRCYGAKAATRKTAMTATQILEADVKQKRNCIVYTWSNCPLFGICIRSGTIMNDATHNARSEAIPHFRHHFNCRHLPFTVHQSTLRMISNYIRLIVRTPLSFTLSYARFLPSCSNHFQS